MFGARASHLAASPRRLAHGQRVLHEMGHPGQALQQLTRAFDRSGCRAAARGASASRASATIWAVKRLGRGHADLGPGVGEERAAPPRA